MYFLCTTMILSLYCIVKLGFLIVPLENSYRIGPFEVESALQEHPAVVESAAVSSPDSIRGEVNIPKTA